MRFKEIDRVVYKHNILFEVIFQARFPEILKIAQGIPVEFQDIVRKEGYLEPVSDVTVFSSNMPNLQQKYSISFLKTKIGKFR